MGLTPLWIPRFYLRIICMVYGILRVAKHTTTNAITHVGKHNARETQPRNADPSRTPDNIQLMGSDDWSRDVNDKLQQLTTKPRKDAVKCFEMVASVSKDFFLDPTTGKPDPKLVRDWGKRRLSTFRSVFPTRSPAPPFIWTRKPRICTFLRSRSSKRT